MKSDERQCRARRADARCQRDARHEGHHRTEVPDQHGTRVIDWAQDGANR